MCYTYLKISIIHPSFIRKHNSFVPLHDLFSSIDELAIYIKFIPRFMIELEHHTCWYKKTVKETCCFMFNLMTGYDNAIR